MNKEVMRSDLKKSNIKKISYDKFWRGGRSNTYRNEILDLGNDNEIDCPFIWTSD
jgi:hypothetical protein